MTIPSSNYLQQVAELGEMQSVVCTENIQSTDGVKLLPKGARINRQVIQQLLKHKLLKPIDFTTWIDDAVDHKTLIALGTEMMARESETSRFFRSLRGEDFVKQSCNRIHLELPIQNKLTVAQKLRPELLEHSLWVALTVTILGEQLGLSEQELEILATAGLLHDLGELHLGIGDLPLEQNLNLSHWQQVRSHPIIGTTILEQFPAYRPHVSRTVQEHHERLDGSGYPLGITAIRMSRTGRLLSFSELAIGALRKYSLRQLGNIVKSNLDALDPKPVSVFLEALNLYQAKQLSESNERRTENVISLFKLISQLVESAKSITHDAGTEATQDKSCLLAPSILKIKLTLQRAGFDLINTQTTLEMIGNDRDSFVELEDLLQESMFQLRKTLLEMHRTGNYRRQNPENEESIQQWIADAEQNLETAASLLQAP